MVDKKTKTENKPKPTSVYKRVIQKSSSSGDFQGQTLIEVSPWEFQGSKGLTLRVKVDKLGYGSQPAKSSFVNIDIGNIEIREALKDAIMSVENL